MKSPHLSFRSLKSFKAARMTVFAALLLRLINDDMIKSQSGLAVTTLSFRSFFYRMNFSGGSFPCSIYRTFLKPADFPCLTLGCFILIYLSLSLSHSIGLMEKKALCCSRLEQSIQALLCFDCFLGIRALIYIVND